MEDLVKEAYLDTARGMTEEEGWIFIQALPEEISFGDECLAVALCRVYPSLRKRLANERKDQDGTKS